MNKILFYVHTHIHGHITTWESFFKILHSDKDSLKPTINLRSCFILSMVFIGKSTRIIFGNVIITIFGQSSVSLSIIIMV